PGPGGAASPARAGRTDTFRWPRGRGRGAWLDRTEESGQRLVRADELGGLDLLVLRVRVAGRSGAEVDGVDAAARELGDRRPRLLRLDGQAARLAQPLHEGRRGHDPRRRRVRE